jgi:hypothetical protein
LRFSFCPGHNPWVPLDKVEGDVKDKKHLSGLGAGDLPDGTRNGPGILTGSYYGPGAGPHLSSPLVLILPCGKQQHKQSLVDVVVESAVDALRTHGCL